MRLLFQCKMLSTTTRPTSGLRRNTTAFGQVNGGTPVIYGVSVSPILFEDRGSQEARSIRFVHDTGIIEMVYADIGNESLM